MSPVEDDHGRPSPLSGLWACVVGGLLLAALLIVLQPVTRVEDCSNYGASGNASAFSNSAWDIGLPLLTAGWMVLIIMEQALPVTWHNRTRLEGWVRAAVAVTASTVAGCCLVGALLGVCR